LYDLGVGIQHGGQGKKQGTQTMLKRVSCERRETLLLSPGSVVLELTGEK